MELYYPESENQMQFYNSTLNVFDDGAVLLFFKFWLSPSSPIYKPLRFEERAIPRNVVVYK
jgi:hypothetical protein